MTDYLFDTDVLVHCLRGLPEMLGLARELTEEGDLHVSVWSHLELYTMARPEEDKRTVDFLAPFILHPVTEPIARRAAELVRGDGAGGARLTLADAIIAATALQHGLTCVSDRVSLRRVEQLKLFPLPPVVRTGGGT